MLHSIRVSESQSRSEVLMRKFYKMHADLFIVLFVCLDAFIVDGLIFGACCFDGKHKRERIKAISKTS